SRDASLRAERVGANALRSKTRVAANHQESAVEYRIISAATPEDLVRLVNESIRQGWEPAGGLCAVATMNAGEYLFAQGMLLRDGSPSVPAAETREEEP